MEYNDIPQIRIFRNFLKYYPEHQTTLETIAQDLYETSRSLMMPSNQACADLLLETLIFDDHTMSKGHSAATRDIWDKLVHRDTHGERPTAEDKERDRELLSNFGNAPPPASLLPAFEAGAAKTAKNIAQGLNDTNRGKIQSLVAQKYLVPIAEIVNEATIVALQDKEYVSQTRETAIFTAPRELDEEEIAGSCRQIITAEMNEALAHSAGDLIEMKFNQLRTYSKQSSRDNDGPSTPSA